MELALKAFSQIDSVIVNHGVLSPVKRLADSTPEEWRSAFDTNFFSALALVSISIVQAEFLLTASRSNPHFRLFVNPKAASFSPLQEPLSERMRDGVPMALRRPL